MLWDQDFKMDGHPDVDPQVGQRVKNEPGSDRDYLTAVPPEPTDVEAERLIAEVRSLTRVAG